jgi:hypothetical protein
MMSSKSIRTALVLPLLLAACAAEESGAPASHADLVAKGLEDHVTVFPDRLEFDADVHDQLEANDVLATIKEYAAQKHAEPVFFVGKPQSDALLRDGSIKSDARNPYGYLRRAVDVTAGEHGITVIKTEPATMAEAIEEIKQRGIIDLGATGSSTLQPKDVNTDGDDVDNSFGGTNKTWHTQLGPEGGYVVVDESDKDLWHHDLLAGGGVRLKISKGTLVITPTVDIHLEVKRFVPQNVTAAITADVKGDLEFLADADGAFDLDQGDTLYKRTFGTSLKGLPLSIDIEAKWSCTLGATSKATATFGAKSAGGVRGELDWQDKFSGKLDPQPFTFDRVGPTLDSNAHLGGNCHVIATVTSHVFDAAGPTVTTDLYSTVDADASNAQATGKGHAKLVAGVNASVGGSINPFGFKIADINVDPYQNEKELFNQDFEVGQ